MEREACDCGRKPTVLSAEIWTCPCGYVWLVSRAEPRIKRGKMIQPLLLSEPDPELVMQVALGVNPIAKPKKSKRRRKPRVG